MSEVAIRVSQYEPQVEICSSQRQARAPTGRLAELKRRFRGEPAAPPPIEFTRTYRRAAYPVTAELYVDALLDHNAFRTLCDTHKTRSAILRALSIAARGPLP